MFYVARENSQQTLKAGLQFSRIIWGFLFDKIGYKKSTIIMLLMMENQ